MRSEGKFYINFNSFTWENLIEINKIIKFLVQILKNRETKIPNSNKNKLFTVLKVPKVVKPFAI